MGPATRLPECAHSRGGVLVSRRGDYTSMSKSGDIMSRARRGHMIGLAMPQELDMFAAVKVIVAIGIAFATMIASIVETPYPRFAICFWVAFGIGVIAAEWMRARRQRRVRYLTRKAQTGRSLRPA